MNAITLKENERDFIACLRRYGALQETFTRPSVRRQLDPVDGQIMEFMAEIFPDEGLDLTLGQFPKNDTRITTLSLCLFTSQSATTVITSGQALANITETTYTS